ncbi:MAG TPA: hypothetical protein VGX25_13495 [Actinophytocola sp.]|uniref:hypothetical protein n=1 Tax=Actinophytocola sp. TaxID=1872138 RepID=UPI002DDD418D|nr:hypothetical protein [Actinophytocola sp.]HEV2780398.1 hypothetical protein [Actinophytocola sp.]
MKTVTKLGVFAGALVVVFSNAYMVGQALGYSPAGPTAAAAAAEEDGPAGLMISQESLTLKVLNDTFPAGAQQTLAFQILERDGKPLQRFTPQHDKLLHLIVARRDLSHFQHVHPNLGPDGTWRIPLTFPEAGEYKIFADFMPAWGIHSITLGTDISVSGDYRPRPLPPVSSTATVEDYTVTMSGRPVPGQSSRLTLHLAKNGTPVTDLEPYLAAYGHLVALRDGDLAYIHVHPDGTPGDGKTKPGPEIVFFTEVPSFGAYRMFLDFQHQGVVRTAAFTVNVDGPNPPPHGLTPEQFEAAKAKNLNGGSGSGQTGESGHGHGG